METRANYVAVGAFVLVTLATFIVAALWFARVQFRQEYVHYVTYFNAVSGLSKEANVRLNGIDVGRVTDLTLDRADYRKVVVRFDIRSDIGLHVGAIASLGSGGLTGQSYLLIEDGPPNAGAIVARNDSGELIVPSRQSTLERLEEAAPEIAAQAAVVATRLAALLNDKNLTAISQTLSNLRDTTAVLAGRGKDLDQIIANSAKATQSLVATLDNVNRTAADLHAVLAKANDIPQRLDTMLVTLDETSRKLGELSGDVDATLRENRPQVKAFAANGLSQLTELSAELRVLVANLSHLSQQIDRQPNRLIFGDRREGYTPQ